nr:MAG TPA: hypothetical protein [Caudoviricetes sp.]
MERVQKATFIRMTVEVNKLTYQWLIQELKNEGFPIAKQTVSSVLAGMLVSPKGDEFLMRAERICKKYKQSFNSNPQSGT